MAASASEVARLRRMVAEPGLSTYTDTDLVEVIERYPLVDSEGLAPDETDWVATYDLNHAAAEVWGEKAAALVTGYDFSADGATYNRSQALENALKMERKYRSLRAARGVPMLAGTVEETEWPTE